MHYRVYRLNLAGRIISGDWIEAASEGEACQIAHALCDEATPKVELWQGQRRLAVLPCSDDQAA